jgi:hypothetical protein
VVKSLADAKVTGWRNMANYWVQYEYTATKKQEYRWFVLYTIPKEIVKQLMAEALNKAPQPDTAEKKNAKDKVAKIMEGNLPALSGAQQDGTAVQ